jgi:Putative Actinobacterial Holin-X, holin superfamily III
MAGAGTSLTAAVHEIVERTRTLARLEGELAALELRRKAASLAAGAIVVAVAILLLLFALGFALAGVAAFLRPSSRPGSRCWSSPSRWCPWRPSRASSGRSCCGEGSRRYRSRRSPRHARPARRSRGTAVAETRSPERVRQEIAVEREGLAQAVDRLREGVGEAADVRRQVRSRLHVVVPVALAVLFVVTGGLRATIGWRSRRLRG